jgi:hypothetical protein
MGKVSEKIKEEFLAMIPPTIFFFFTLGLVAVVRMLMTKEPGFLPARRSRWRSAPWSWASRC